MYFEARRRNGGKACEGEESCAQKGRPDGGRGLRDRPDQTEAVCKNCPFAPTKPSDMPIHLAPFVVRAFRMEALFEGGAGVPYPQYYTPLEWECFLALKQSRAKDLDKDLPKPKEPARDSQIAKLRALSHGW